MNFEIFKYRINNIPSTLNSLKNKLLEEKAIHSKYKLKIKKMNERELKNFLYCNELVEKEFEGVGILFIYSLRKDFRRLTKYIISLNLNGINILRIFVYSLQNKENYNGKFLGYLKEFDKIYGKKFRNLLFEIGQKYYITKVDVISLFFKLIVE